MILAGIDVGAKNVKVVLMQDGNVIGKALGVLEMEREKSINDIFDKCLMDSGLKRKDIAYIVGTGAGRKSVSFAQKDSTMVTCDALGIIKIEPTVRTLIDIGANEARAIRCDETGKVNDFAINEKCAAGSGAFIEAMARAMEISLDEFAVLSLESQRVFPINAQCAIFAESEVVSLVHEGTDRNDICKAVHDAMAGRIASMARRVRIEKDVALIGGGALNKGLVESLKRDLQVDFIIPKEPMYVGALGAAILALQMVKE